MFVLLWLLAAGEQLKLYEGYRDFLKGLVQIDVENQQQQQHPQPQRQQQAQQQPLQPQHARKV